MYEIIYGVLKEKQYSPTLTKQSNKYKPGRDVFSPLGAL